MADAAVANTTAGVQGRELLLADGAPQTVSKTITFDNGASPPYAVSAGSDVVPNLDADKLDGQEGTDYHDAAQLTGVVPADVAAGVRRFTEETTALTGAQADFDLDAVTTLLRCTGAAPVFSGFSVAGAAPSPGDRVILECLGATSLKVTNEGAGSTAANRIICPSTAGLIVGVGGSILLRYDGTADRWRASTLSPGASIDVAHDAGNFTAQAGNWTVDLADQVEFNYRQENNYVTVSWVIQNTDVSATPAYLAIAIPNGFTAKKETWGVCDILDAGANREAGKITLPDSSAVIRIHRNNAGGATWNTTAGDNSDVRGTITFEVN